MKHKMKYLFIALSIIASFVLLNLTNAYALEITPVPTPMPAIIQYDLAFPGILPDHALYKLKVLRDKIQLAITSDHKKRIELYLRRTDKGVLASAMLVDKNEWNLAKKTALKAEHNMTLLTPEIYGMEEPIDQTLMKKLQTASLKHQEVFAKLRDRVPADTQLIFSQVIDFSKRNQSEIEKYIEQ